MDIDSCLECKCDHCTNCGEEYGWAANKRILELEDTLRQLRSQLLDVHSKDSILITIIDQKLNNDGTL